MKLTIEKLKPSDVFHQINDRFVDWVGENKNMIRETDINPDFVRSMNLSKEVSMIIMEKMGLKSQKADYNAGFVHGMCSAQEDVFIRSRTWVSTLNKALEEKQQ